MNEIEEIWKDIEGYEGLYQISNLGRVKSLGNNKTKKEKILKLSIQKNGYVKVDLSYNKLRNTFKVHRLVAQAFIDNPNNYPQINHKDENKTNNIISNLEWCTASYNQNYGTCIKRRIEHTDWESRNKNIDWGKRTAKINYKKIAEKLSKQVYQYSIDLKLIKIWESTRECKKNGFNQGAVAACCRGERKSHKGFIWSYEEIKK